MDARLCSTEQGNEAGRGHCYRLMEGHSKDERNLWSQNNFVSKLCKH